MLHGGSRGVGTVASDGGQRLGGYPTLELLCLRQLRGEDEGVEARLVDEGHILHSSKGVTFRYPL